MQVPTPPVIFIPSTNCNFIDNTVYSLTGPLVRNKVPSGLSGVFITFSIVAAIISLAGHNYRPDKTNGGH